MLGIAAMFFPASDLLHFTREGVPGLAGEWEQNTSARPLLRMTVAPVNATGSRVMEGDNLSVCVSV